MRRPLLLAAAAVLAALAAFGPGAPGQAATSCRNLPVTDAIRTALKKAHGSRDGAISKGSIYYGRCGSTQYAIASFSKALADQPEKFRKLSGRGWVDKGDGFEAGCDAGARHPVPKALVRLWGRCPQF